MFPTRFTEKSFAINLSPSVMNNATNRKPAFNVGPPSARQRNTNFAFSEVLGSSLPSSFEKKLCQSRTPSDKTFSIRALRHKDTIKLNHYTMKQFNKKLIGIKHNAITPYKENGSKQSIGVAPITQVTHVRNKNSNIQGRSLYVIYVIFNTISNCS